ncbi:pseudouridine synthase [Thiomicrorhabdus aquaedulcis]|uniref:pseudouridine synthase n=1 Tax=Thiomicrorhabdus aquaedulcis TaxID=2211106 RepID=UPI000FDC30E0|nr:16S rRNA pseudouridine(516) synthase [Thiomicrorhabdus aquaedulcis]
MRLDRFLTKQAQFSRQRILQLIAQRQITVDQTVVSSRLHPVTAFSHIYINGQPLKANAPARYFMMNKPAGILSATVDSQHTTALELLHQTDTTGLHIAGRLDRATTGLLIITNDGQWSRRLTEPRQKIPKTYHVHTAYALSPTTQDAFARGILLKPEHITTQPAQLTWLTPQSVYLTIYEGRYHQVKRMFAAVGNRVTQLHRVSMGTIVLDETLKAGDYRPLNTAEIDSI